MYWVPGTYVVRSSRPGGRTRCHFIRDFVCQHQRLGSTISTADSWVSAELSRHRRRCGSYSRSYCVHSMSYCVGPTVYTVCPTVYAHFTSPPFREQTTYSELELEMVYSQYQVAGTYQGIEYIVLQGVRRPSREGPLSSVRCKPKISCCRYRSRP